jgi:integrase
VLIFDETGFLKKGRHSAGVKRQYSGTAEHIENSQVGVFLRYGVEQGATLIDLERYIPQEWAEDEERLSAAGIPESLEFATKPELAREMIQRAVDSGATAAWITADEVYGHDSKQCRFLEGRQMAYELAVASDQRLWQADLMQHRVDGIPRRLPASEWKRLSAGCGSKGERLYYWASMRLSEQDGWMRALLVRRSIEENPECAYYLSYAPSGNVLNAAVSSHTRRNYAKALDELFAFRERKQQPLSRALLMEYRPAMLERNLSPSTINVRLSAVRKLIGEARRNGILGPEQAAQMADIPNIRQQGTRLGNWLTRDQAKELLAVSDRTTLKGKRDAAILALLVGCALRRAELHIEDIRKREGRWVIAGLTGKGGRIRTVAVPLWVKRLIDAWMADAGHSAGRLLRPVNKSGRVVGGGIERLRGLERGRAIGEIHRDGAFRRSGTAPQVRKIISQKRRRPGADQVSAWPCLHPNRRTLSRLRAGDRRCRQRQSGV